MKPFTGMRRTITPRPAKVDTPIVCQRKYIARTIWKGPAKKILSNKTTLQKDEVLTIITNLSKTFSNATHVKVDMNYLTREC